MKIETRDFGTIEIDEKDVLTFRQPIYGFEQLTKYVILTDEEMRQDFIWLQSLEDADTCFILADPSLLDIEYHPVFPSRLRELLGEGDGICWCIVTIPAKFEKATVNLKSPVVVNPAQMCAAQVILEGDYPIRQPLMSGGERKEKVKC